MPTPEARITSSQDQLVVLVPLASIRPSPRNPRRGAKHIDELAASLHAHGLLQPVVLRPSGREYEVVAGHRRLEAALSLGWAELPATIREEDDDEAYLLTLVENLQRESLSPREEASALEVLLREHKWTTRQVAEAISRSPAYVSKRLRIFEDPVLSVLVMNNSLTVSAAEELLPLEAGLKRELAEQAAVERWDHPQLRAAIRARFESKHRVLAGLGKQTRELRRTLREVAPSDLSELHRRELRGLFMELVMLARAPTEKRKLVFPPLPQVAAARTRR
jgi:ParB family chromosome partitioning protein